MLSLTLYLLGAGYALTETMPNCKRIATERGAPPFAGQVAAVFYTVVWPVPVAVILGAIAWSYVRARALRGA